MTKYTKKQYIADVAANEVAVAENKAELACYLLRSDAGEVITPEWSDKWNAAHDRTIELVNERFWIEQKWGRRNWNWQDHAEHELVSQNID